MHRTGPARRRFLRRCLTLAGLGLLSACGTLPVPGRQAAKVPRIGWLSAGGQQQNAEAFRQGLAEMGYLEGSTVAVEWRDAQGQLERIPDLAVELVHRGSIDEPRSSLGRYLVRYWEQLAAVNGESLVYWLRKLVFRGAWLDHRVKEGLLEVTWDEDSTEFGYCDPRGDRALVELAPVPSWHEVQFKRG